MHCISIVCSLQMTSHRVLLFVFCLFKLLSIVFDLLTLGFPSVADMVQSPTKEGAPVGGQSISFFLGRRFRLANG